MNSPATVWVPGDPQPKGSLRCVGRPGGRHQLIEDDKTGARKQWRHKVAAAATLLLDRHPAIDGTITGPVTIGIVFVLSPPKTRPKGRWAPSVKPDVDKLSRMILDALVDGHLIADDALVVGLTAEKRYAPCHTASAPGALITIRPSHPSDSEPGQHALDRPEERCQR